MSLALIAVKVTEVLKYYLDPIHMTLDETSCLRFQCVSKFYNVDNLCTFAFVLRCDPR